MLQGWGGGLALRSGKGRGSNYRGVIVGSIEVELKRLLSQVRFYRRYYI